MKIDKLTLWIWAVSAAIGAGTAISIIYGVKLYKAIVGA